MKVFIFFRNSCDTAPTEWAGKQNVSAHQDRHTFHPISKEVSYNWVSHPFVTQAT